MIDKITCSSCGLERLPSKDDPKVCSSCYLGGKMIYDALDQSLKNFKHIEGSKPQPIKTKHSLLIVVLFGLMIGNGILYLLSNFNIVFLSISVISSLFYVGYHGGKSVLEWWIKHD